MAAALDRLLELTRDQYGDVRYAVAAALGRIMATGVRIFKVPGWRRHFPPHRAYRVTSLEELDPEPPAAL
jgi:hypothetical protein